MKAGIYSGDF